MTRRIVQPCPTKGWSEKLAQRALGMLANEGCLAALCTRYDLTINDIENKVKNTLEIIAPHLRDHSLWLLGEPGNCKTPLGRIMAMMFSQFHGGDGCYRTASELNGFRGVMFTKMVPALFNDEEIGSESAKKKKAFSDVGDIETILKERWTAAKFVMSQLRVVQDNPCYPDAKPQDNGTPDALIVHRQVFLRMIRPAIGYISLTDSMAILKHVTFVVSGKNRIYYRTPNEQQVPVRRIRWSKVDVIKDASKPKLSNYKKTCPVPADDDIHVNYEAEWLKEAIRKHEEQSTLR